nr:reverse transcriptase domain-containing protein [Tanacetum cinerariifolium]
MASSSGSGTLPGNTVTNPKEDLKGITTRSGVAYKGPTIPTPSKVVKQDTEATKDPVQTTSPQNTAHVQPPVTQSETPVSESIDAPVSAPMPNLKPSIPYPSRRDDERRPLIGNKEKLSEMARTPMNKHCSAIILNKLPKKLGDPGKFLIPCEFPGMDEYLALADLELTPTCMTLELVDRSVSKPIGIAKDVKVKVGMFHFPADFVVVDFEQDPRVPLILGSDFLLFEEANAFLGLEDDPDSPELDPSYYDPEGDIQMLEAILNSDLAPSLPNHEQSVPSFTNELKACEAEKIKSSVDEPPEVELKDLPPHLEYAFLEGDNKLHVIIAKELGEEEKAALIKVELKDLPPHLEYAFLEGDNKLPVIIAKELGEEEKAALIKILKSHKRAIAWKLSDIQEVEKLLDAGLIYPISNSPWVSPVHCVPKKGGFTVVKNEEN